VGKASGPASPVLRWYGRRVGSLGPGLTSESADAARAVLLTICRPGPSFYGTHRHCRSDLPGLDQRPGFADPTASGCVPSLQPEKRDGSDHCRDARDYWWRGYPRRHSCCCRTGSSRRAARRAGVPGHSYWLCPAAGLAGRVRNGVPGRDRGHRQLRRRPVPLRDSGRRPGRRGRPLGPAGPPPGGQIRSSRRGQRRPGRSVRPGPWPPKGRDGAVEAIRA
jgi:hypothetical protein